jgi:hypothetical protein
MLRGLCSGMDEICHSDAVPKHKKGETRLEGGALQWNERLGCFSET